MTGVERSVHVRVSHCGKVFWVTLAELIGICCSVFLYGWSIDVEESLFLPSFLILFLDRDEGVSFVCLEEKSVSQKRNGGLMLRLYSHSRA